MDIIFARTGQDDVLAGGGTILDSGGIGRLVQSHRGADALNGSLHAELFSTYDDVSPVVAIGMAQ